MSSSYVRAPANCKGTWDRIIGLLAGNYARMSADKVIWQKSHGNIRRNTKPQVFQACAQVMPSLPRECCTLADHVMPFTEERPASLRVPGVASPPVLLTRWNAGQEHVQVRRMEQTHIHVLFCAKRKCKYASTGRRGGTSRRSRRENRHTCHCSKHCDCGRDLRLGRPLLIRANELHDRK